MVSNTEGITYNIPLDVGMYSILKQPTVIKFLSQFLTLLYVTQKLMYVDQKQKKELWDIQTGSSLWSIIHKRRGHTKMNSIVKQYLHYWVLHYPEVVQAPVTNDKLKVSIYGQHLKIVPKLL